MKMNIHCAFKTPCGWCTRQNKKCEKEIDDCTPSVPMSESHAQKIINDIKSGKLPPLGADPDFGLQTLNETRKQK